ncbi:MAG: DNA methyltransferase [Bacteroidota bacterium]|nr:DNA methyltransferase [Bacteroidota bacterium]
MKYNERMKKQGEYELSFEPKSIWNYKRNNTLEDICNTEYKKTTDKSNGNWMKAGNGTFFSGWNKEYQKRIIELWSPVGGSILDPFAGHSSAFMPFLMGRDFYGFEITKERFETQQTHINILSEKFTRTNKVNLFNDSSEYMDNYIEDNSIDCVVTDPPFWNLEKYEEPVNGTQLSDLSDKTKFDKMFKHIIQKSINKLKPSGFIAVKIANFRRKGIYLNLKDEWVKFIEAMGVELVDEIIIELSPVKRHPLYNQAITNLNCLKVHEFLIVFRKKQDKESDDENNNSINFSRPLVSDVYEDEDRLFWSSERNKIDWITEGLKTELEQSNIKADSSEDINILF